MAGEFFSTSWYRVERVRPRLRSHVHLLRQEYRGRTWYALQDLASDRFHRFASAAYLLIGLMDGKRTVREIWEAATGTLGDEAPSQDEFIRLLSQLHAADLLVCDVLPDTAELSQRAQRQGSQKWKSQLFNVFAWKFPLCDPDAFLTRFLPLLRPLIGWAGFAFWLCIVGLGVALGALHWPALSRDMLDQLLAPRNLLLIWLLFPVIKLLHELGHGFATKRFGGDVHGLGAMILVLTPVPYVEASAAWAFPSKWQRIVVGAAGMMVELFLASLALIVWVNAEPGLVRLLAYNTVLIAGISTVIFNANPLLRFDGYYMLMDWLEIPNLRARATQYLSYLCERYLFGQREASLSPTTRGERVWFVLYGLLSSAYRILVVVGILLYLGDEFPLVAVLFAGLTAITMLVVPVIKAISFVVTNPRLRLVRVRAIATSMALVAGIAVVICLVPAPFHTTAEGVVWIPDEATVRAGSDGFVERVVASPGSLVKTGDVLVRCRNPRFEADQRILRGRVRELEARYAEQIPVDLVKAAIVAEELEYARRELARVQKRVDELTIKSKADGVFVLSAEKDWPGRFLHQGEVLAHVVDLKVLTVRTIVQQADIDLIRHMHERVQVRLAEDLGMPLQAAISRVVPAALNELPSRALGTEGGGAFAVDPVDREGTKTLQKFFQIDLRLTEHAGVVNAGGRVYVRFSYDWVPLSVQWSRQVRQLFLARFNV
jgi:putative peptide zinc metalloprotease protein